MTWKLARELGRGNKVVDNMSNAEVKLLGSLSTTVVIYCIQQASWSPPVLNDPTKEPRRHRIMIDCSRVRELQLRYKFEVQIYRHTAPFRLPFTAS